jgi:hypothetical protein
VLDAPLAGGQDLLRGDAGCVADERELVSSGRLGDGHIRITVLNRPDFYMIHSASGERRHNPSSLLGGTDRNARALHRLGHFLGWRLAHALHVAGRFEVGACQQDPRPDANARAHLTAPPQQLFVVTPHVAHGGHTVDDKEAERR